MKLSEEELKEKQALIASNQDYRTKQVQIKSMKLFLKKEILPVTCNRPGQMTEEYHTVLLRHYGFRVDAVSGGFIHCRFPKGWKKRLSGDAVWCYLYDDKMRKRAAIFYKVLRRMPNGDLDVSTFINYMTRYRARSYVDPKDRFHFIGEALDSETKVIYKKDIYLAEGMDEKAYKVEKSLVLNDLFSGCEGWLKKNYPNFMNISEYWIEPKKEGAK